MKNKIKLYVIFSLIFVASCTKDNDEFTYPLSHEGEWLLTSNLFDSLLTFRRIIKSDSSIVFGKQFTFDRENLKFKHFNPVPSCGNGMFYMDSCAYFKEDELFTIFLKGGYMLESSFIFNAKYLRTHMDNSNFTLSRTEIIKNEKSSIFEN